jgi:hypothetical protein
MLHEGGSFVTTTQIYDDAYAKYERRTQGAIPEREGFSVDDDKGGS